MTSRNINPVGLSQPSGFSHATRAGDTVHLGGQTAMDAAGRIVDGGIVEQFRQAFSNVLIALDAAGGVPTDLVSITIYLTDLHDYQRNGREIGRVWRELAGAHYPAMAGVGVTALWQPDALIEIQGIAVIAPDSAAGSGTS
ncbi:RidA family protein [Microcella sp.]|uniref:RidA family protein n=1 Tax=Microcella sp. TaxID=1913979 RepID=UPI003F71A686